MFSFRPETELSNSGGEVFCSFSRRELQGSKLEFPFPPLPTPTPPPPPWNRGQSLKFSVHLETKLQNFGGKVQSLVSAGKSLRGTEGWGPEGSPIFFLSSFSPDRPKFRSFCLWGFSRGIWVEFGFFSCETPFHTTAK